MDQGDPPGAQYRQEGAPISGIKEAPKISIFKAAEIPTISFAQAPKFLTADFFSFSVKISDLEGLDKVLFSQAYKIRVKEQVFFYRMDQYFCTKV